LYNQTSFQQIYYSVDRRPTRRAAAKAAIVDLDDEDADFLLSQPSESPSSLGKFAQTPPPPAGNDPPAIAAAAATPLPLLLLLLLLLLAAALRPGLPFLLPLPPILLILLLLLLLLALLLHRLHARYPADRFPRWS